VPPLGLITVSAMLPDSWQKKVVDMNVSTLQTSDILWADYVFISAMYIQKESVSNIIKECTKHKIKMVAGGPLFTQEYENYPEIDHFILNEAEITLPPFLKDLENGTPTERIYKTSEYADIKSTPVPDYHLLSMKDYAFMNVQVSRGCPFSCDFFEITTLLGHKVRMKETSQVIKELDILYKLNWRGPVVIVDDNFIGDKKIIKNNLLPAMKKWMQSHKYPFVFNAETSVNLADDEELMTLMVEAGFTSTFVGIETPDEKSLQDCNKKQNSNRDLLQSVKKMQKAGLQVSGGFIVGFDSDTPEATGNNCDSSMNFVPKMNTNDLLEGYKKIIRNIYGTKPYYMRIRQFLLNYKRLQGNQMKIEFFHVGAFIKSIIIVGILNKGRVEYWKLLIWTLFRKPWLMVDAITFAVYGYHFQTIYGLRNNQKF
jgi:radical SAM superfamily enzyme YgiQ (UPF0313 family)